MNTMARKAASGFWSVLCMLVAALLVGTFFYWVVLQRATITLRDEAVKTEYTATAGSVVYIENRINTSQVAGRIEYTNILSSLDHSQRYVLPSPEESRQESEAATKIIPDSTAASLYAVYIPTWVRPGVYEYQVTAHFRLNPIKTEEVDLPVMTIKVE